ncbi:MAG: hypothetical protein KME21_01245 [Desmonostoc vinosum HA7617-LM4]|nr:hypothetical protein [Desmonostoc vinosum HA7617-LM4]
MKQTNFSKLDNSISTKIVSDTPGRLRLRIARPDRQSKKIQHIVNLLEAQPHINQVRTNIDHGSIVINYDSKSSNLKNLLTALQDLGIIFTDITVGNTEAAASLSNAVIDLNRQVKQATNSVVDLRFLFPMGLSILAVRQLAIRGLQFEVIPWYVLAWYAFDSFIKLNVNGIYSPQANEDHL